MYIGCVCIGCYGCWKKYVYIQLYIVTGHTTIAIYYLHTIYIITPNIHTYTYLWIHNNPPYTPTIHLIYTHIHTYTYLWIHNNPPYIPKLLFLSMFSNMHMHSSVQSRCNSNPIRYIPIYIRCGSDRRMGQCGVGSDGDTCVGVVVWWGGQLVSYIYIYRLQHIVIYNQYVYILYSIYYALYIYIYMY